MKKTILFAILFFAVAKISTAQNVGIGTTAPKVRLSVDSSIMIDQSNSNTGNLGRGALLFGDDGKVGIGRSWLNGSVARSGLSFYTNNLRRMTIDSTGNVLMFDATVGNALGIGTSSPEHAFQNLRGYNHMQYSLAVGPSAVPGSTWMLDVNGGDARFQQDVSVLGNTTVTGSLTVNNNKGVVYNGASSANLRIVPFTTATFGAVLGPFGSAETTIGLPNGFTTPPRVFVGNVRVTGGTAGELNRVILVLWGCDTNSCNAKIINTDNASVNYNITWDCLAIGF
jgi:hypothetical protein